MPTHNTTLFRNTRDRELCPGFGVECYVLDEDMPPDEAPVDQTPALYPLKVDFVPSGTTAESNAYIPEGGTDLTALMAPSSYDGQSVAFTGAGAFDQPFEDQSSPTT